MRGRPRPEPPRTARSAALRLLGRRDYTSAEIRLKLARLEYDEAEIDAALTDLGRAGLIDDRRAGCGADVRELEARGLDRALAKDLTRAVSPDDERAAIERILAAKRLPHRLSAADHRRVFQQLMRRGFPPDIIARVLRTRTDDTI